MAVLKVQESEFELFPEGYQARAKIVAIDPKTIKWTDDKGDQSADIFEFDYVFTDGEFEGKHIKGSADAFVSDHPRNRLRPIIEAVIGQPLEVGQVIDTDDYIGRHVIVVVGHRPDRKDPSVVWSEVKEVLPDASRQEVPF